MNITDNYGYEFNDGRCLFCFTELSHNQISFVTEEDLSIICPNCLVDAVVTYPVLPQALMHEHNNLFGHGTFLTTYHWPPQGVTNQIMPQVPPPLNLSNIIIHRGIAVVMRNTNGQ